MSKFDWWVYDHCLPVLTRIIGSLNSFLLLLHERTYEVGMKHKQSIMRLYSLLDEILQDEAVIHVNAETLVELQCMMEYVELIPDGSNRVGTLHYYGEHAIIVDSNLGDGIVSILGEDGSQWTISHE